MKTKEKTWLFEWVCLCCNTIYIYIYIYIEIRWCKLEMLSNKTCKQFSNWWKSVKKKERRKDKRLGFEREWGKRKGMREREKKGSLKNWYVTSCGWPRSRDVIGETLTHFSLWVNFFFNFSFPNIWGCDTCLNRHVCAPSIVIY